MYYYFLLENNTIKAKYKSKHKPTSSNTILVDEDTWNKAEIGFIYEDGEIKYPDDYLDNLKVQLKQKVADLRKRKEDEGVIIQIGENSYHFETDAKTRANIIAVVNAYNLGILDKAKDKVAWKLKDNSFTELTYYELVQVGNIMLKYIESLFVAEAQHNKAIDALQSVEEAEQYDVEQGWPDTTYIVEVNSEEQNANS